MSKWKSCNKCGGHIRFEKLQGSWKALDFDTGQRHDCRRTIRKQEARTRQRNYDDKKYGKNSSRAIY